MAVAITLGEGCKQADNVQVQGLQKPLATIVAGVEHDAVHAGDCAVDGVSPGGAVPDRRRCAGAHGVVPLV
jgi:hypothetical protein